MRVPLKPHVGELQKILEADEMHPKPFRREMREAFGTPLWLRVRKVLDEKERDWKRLVSYYDDPGLLEHVTPDVRLFRALGLCMLKREEEGLDAACELVPAMDAADLEEDAQANALWHNVLEANINRAFQAADAERTAVVAKVRAKVEAVPDTPTTAAFRRGCLERIDEAAYILESQALVKAGKFADAKAWVKLMKEDDDASRKLKENLLKQIGEAEEAAGLHKLLEGVVKQVQALIERDAFDEARRLVRTLPDNPSEVREHKAEFLKQIDQVAGQAKAHAQLKTLIDETFANVQRLVNQGKKAAARAAVNALPDHPPDLIELKQNWLSQIG